MKLKGINPIEQHVEKIVLGVFALVLLAIFAWQFIGNPNAVQVGQQKVSPEKAADVVRDMARQVEGKLDSAAAPAIPPQPSVLASVKQGLEAGAASSVAGAAPVRLAGVVGGSAPIVTPGPGGGDKPGAGAFALFEPPAATSVVASINESTIDPVVPLVVPEAREYLPKEQPFDLRSVSVQASIDARRVRAALTQGAGGQAIPAAWWQAKVEVLDVELQRETRRADGSWGDAVTIKPFPGAASLRQRLRDPGTKPADLTAILETEKAQRQSIRRPDYWATISGTPWVTPSEAAGSGTPGAPPEVQAKLRQIKERRERVDRLTAQIQRLDRPPGGGAGGGRDDRDGPGAPPRPPGGNPPGGSPPGGSPPGGPPPRDDRSAARKAELQKQLAAASEELAKFTAELNALGYDDKGNKLGGEVKAFSEPLSSVTESTTELITVWAHDPSARPGQTYRYRVVVWFTNPFFGNAAALDDAQKSRAAAPATPAAPSEWSAPVSVDPSIRYVLLSAREAGQIGAGSASIYSDAAASGELYKFFYGYWRRADVNMNPGDRVSGTLTLPTLERFELALNASGQPDLAAMKATPIDPKQSVALDEYFIDASAVSGGSGVEAVMRSTDPAGGLLVIRPGSDQDDAVRARLNASAAAGANAKVLAPGSGKAGSAGPGPDPRGGPPSPGGDPDRE